MRIFLCLLMIKAFAAFNLTWGVPAIGIDANPPIGDTDSNARIAMDAMGNAYATWSRTTGKKASEDIWASLYNHSIRVWTGAVQISGGGCSANPHVATDVQGNAIYVWEEGFPTRIYTRTLSNTGVWSPDLSMPPEVIRSSFYTQTMPQICISRNGDAILIWSELIQGKNQIFSAKKPFNMSWEYLGRISQENCYANLIPSKALSVNAEGDAIAIWEQDGCEIHGATFFDGVWSESFTVVKADAAAKSPSAAIDEQKNGVIVWSQNGQICSKKIINQQLIDQVYPVSNTNYPSSRPHVRMDMEGNTVVVFERSNGMHKFIAGSTWKKGSSNWSPQVDISGPSPADSEVSGYPVFCMNTIGDGVVIWKEWTGTNMIIQGAGYSLDTWSFIKTLSSVNADSGANFGAYDISVTLNDAGNILAIWPEDPYRTGAQQIKATSGVGLANLAPMPPVADPVTIFDGIVSGHQIMHKFPAHCDLINILSWTAPQNVSHYNIYRENLVSRIAMTKDTRYEDHQRRPKKRETYLITSVDFNGQESSPMTIVVDPK